MLTVHVHDGIETIDRAAWDALGNDPFSALATLAAVESAGLPGVDLRYVTVHDRGGDMLGAAPLTRIAIDGGRLTHGVFRSAIHAIRRARPGFLHTRLLVCGTPLSVANPPLRVRQGADPGAVAEAVADAMVDLSGPLGTSWLVFKELRERDLPGPGATGGRMPPSWTVVPSEPTARLDLRWDSFASYLGALRSHYRYKIRTAGRSAKASGIAVDVLPLADGYSDDVHALYESVLDRAVVQFERLTPAFFTGLGRAFGERAALIRFRRDGRVVGWVALLMHRGEAWDLFHGIDYAENRASGLYFNQLAEAVRFAITCRARTLWLGQSTEVAKARFGARSVPLWIALRHRSPAVRWGLRRGGRVLFPAKRVPERHVFRSGNGGGGGTGDEGKPHAEAMCWHFGGAGSRRTSGVPGCGPYL